MTAVTDPPVSPRESDIADLLVSPDRAAEIKRDAILWPSWDLTPRQQCDLELLANGAFSPLTGVHGPGRLVGGVLLHAPGRRHPVAHPRHPRRFRGGGPLPQPR